jgi:histone acetyltransferase 1
MITKVLFLYYILFRETIFGYENLSIKVSMMAGSLKTHMGMKFNRKISKALSDGLEPDDVIKKMNQVLRGGYTQNFDEFSGFLEKEEKDFKPFGELVHNFTTQFIPNKNKPKDEKEPKMNGVSTTNGYSSSIEKCFEIYLVDAKTPKFIEYLKRMETFLLFFIDAGSYTDCEGDDKWKFFTL